MNRNITNNKQYKNYQINNGKQNDFYCFEKTLNQLIDMVECGISEHSKYLVVRLDIRNTQEGNSQITRKSIPRIMENTKRIIERKYKDSPNKPDFKFVLTMENEGKENVNPHCHVLAGVNGNAIQNGYAVLSAMEKAVNLHLGEEQPGLVNFPKSNGNKGIMIDRNSNDFQKKLNDAVYAGSYLAKTNTKEGIPKGGRVSSASHIGEKQRAKRDKFFEEIRKKQDQTTYSSQNKYDTSYDDNFSMLHKPDLFDDRDEFDDDDDELDEGKYYLGQ